MIAALKLRGFLGDVLVLSTGRIPELLRPSKRSEPSFFPLSTLDISVIFFLYYWMPLKLGASHGRIS
jgi:hypothetical protein